MINRGVNEHSHSFAVPREEKAPTGAFSLSKVPIRTFTIKNHTMINGRLNMVSLRVVWLSLKPQSVMITQVLLVMNGLKILHRTEHPVDLSAPDMYLRYLSRNLKTESITSHNLQPTTQIILTKLRRQCKKYFPFNEA